MSTVSSKQPSENLLYDFDLSDWLRDSTDLIISVISVADDLTPALVFGAPSYNGQTVQVTISGGVDNTVPKITVKVTTSVSPIVEADFYLPIVEV